MNSLTIATLILASCGLVGCDQVAKGGHGQSRPDSTPVATTGDADAELGQRLVLQRKFAAAIPLLESALAKPLAITPRSHVLTTLGRCYDGLEQFERSLEYHDRALREDPLNYSAHVNKGVVYRLMGDYEKAAASYATALKMAPEYAELHSSLGTLAIFQSHFDQAVVHLERAVALNDSLAASHSNLALAYASVGRFDDADLALKKAVLRGYHQPEVVRLRIERLKAMTRTRRETDHIVAQ